MYEYENQNQNWNLGQPVQTPEPQKPNKQKKPHNFARGRQLLSDWYLDWWPAALFRESILLQIKR